MSRKKVCLFGTNRHAICINDYYMFFRLSDHDVSHIFYPLGSHVNRDWWEFGGRDDKARNSVVVPMVDYDGFITVWDDLESQVFPILDEIEFDYICLANGTDPAHIALIERYGADRFLFSEYGWLPWSRHFYISRKGAGARSEIAQMSQGDVARIGVDMAGIADFCSTLDCGAPVPYNNYVYMPLQKDVNDFKFLDNDFADNKEYLRFAESVVPARMNILVKCHPLYKVKYDLSFSDRMIDITDMELNKHQLYRDMVAMVCLNSTSVLEALAFGGAVFTYGDDLFTGKGITHHKIQTREEFERLLSQEQDRILPRKFVSLLLSRQIDRSRCRDEDRSYVANHYWNQCL